MTHVAILGASGYTGAQLVKLVERHPHLTLTHTCVSANSADAGKPIGELHGDLAHLNHTLTPIDDELLAMLASRDGLIFLATPHEASHDWMPVLRSANATVLDLSGAFRIKDKALFSHFYGFSHAHPGLLDDAVYGLAEWYAESIAAAKLIAVPGCYPTASLTALKPLIHHALIDPSLYPVINAVSGVTGAGRKASLTTSFCEVSLNAYGVLGHRHTPEISAYLGVPVIFTPHLGNFKRGILATITVKIRPGVTASDIHDAYQRAYEETPLVRLRGSQPKIDDVVNTPFADVHYVVDENSGYAVITCAIDNLMKGAASQAIQCANLVCQWPVATGLLP
ncbi:N-acetyl-gamma-glutamyl-phosphate reductase [Alteromonas sp. CYL-A6]|uniref:N-acetyl-gamma-glutamyl-phosphate reductase n=1 Tax=Alteromonas nitratireducens TaxID=3390813 RepID=UPI0034B8BE31